jgi:cytoskeleton protein RodZ
MDSATDNTAAAEAPRSPGAILAAERERQGLSRADIAQRLHMSVSQVEALEIGDYERLPRGTFLRGFARNYARSLGMDAEGLVGLLAQEAPREKAPTIVVPSQNIRFDPLGQRLSSPYVKAAGIAAAALVLGFAAMYWWLFIRPHGAQAPRQPAQVSRPASQPSAAPAQATPAPAAPAAPAEAPARPPAPQEAPPPATVAVAPAQDSAAPAAAPSPASASRAAPPVPPVIAGDGLIKLSFGAAAWVEIVDSRGKVLLSRTHPGGSTVEVAGKPPFNVVVGNAPEVRMTYNGRDFDLAPHTRVAVARFTLP